MPAILDELITERSTELDKARAIEAKAKSENRSMDDAEAEAAEKHLETVSELNKKIEKEKKKQDLSARIAHEHEASDRSQGRRSQAGDPNPTTSSTNKSYTFKFRGKDVVLAESSMEARRHMPDMRSAHREWLIGGRDGKGSVYADLQTDVDGTGGYLTNPEEFVAGILKTADDDVSMRRLARKIIIKAESTGIRCRMAKASTAAWGPELDNTYTHRDRSMRFGKRVLRPHYMTGEIVISRDLLRASVIDVEELVADEINRDFGELEELGFLLGNGKDRPLGVFTASSDGISTARDITEGTTPTSFGFDALVAAKYSLKPKYRSRATWLFHRTTIKRIALMKDGEGQYLWQPSRVAGEPDRVLALPYVENEFIPNTFTAGNYYGAIGDFSYYYIADQLFMDMQRLIEKYAETNQIAFVYRKKTDGMPVLEEAFTRLQLASS